MAVIAINALISAAGAVLIWGLIRARRSLAALTQWFEATERDLAQTLPQAALSLQDGAAASRQAAQKLTRVKQQWQLFQQLLTLISLGQALRRQFRRYPNVRQQSGTVE